MMDMIFDFMESNLTEEERNSEDRAYQEIEKQIAQIIGRKLKSFQEK